MKKVRYWTMCFILGYLENRQSKFKRDGDMYNAYKKVISDIKGEYLYE